MNFQNLPNPFSNGQVYYRDVTGSTMDDSKKKALDGILHGSIFIAEFQEKGRGRVKGRSWQSGKGESLMFTLVLRRDRLTQELHHMPLLAGAALINASSRYCGEDFSLKWPNDLLFMGKKCAGILCEADGEYFYCGVGINCNQTGFPPEIRDKATSLKIIQGREVDRLSFLWTILDSFKSLLEAGSSWRSVIDSHLYLDGQYMEVLSGQAGSGKIIRGINLGIGEDGQLLIKDERGIVNEIYAGEIEI